MVCQAIARKKNPRAKRRYRRRIEHEGYEGRHPPLGHLETARRMPLGEIMPHGKLF